MGRFVKSCSCYAIDFTINVLISRRILFPTLKRVGNMHVGNLMESLLVEYFFPSFDAYCWNTSLLHFLRNFNLLLRILEEVIYELEGIVKENRSLSQFLSFFLPFSFQLSPHPHPPSFHFCVTQSSSLHLSYLFHGKLYSLRTPVFCQVLSITCLSPMPMVLSINILRRAYSHPCINHIILYYKYTLLIYCISQLLCQHVFSISFKQAWVFVYTCVCICMSLQTETRHNHLSMFYAQYTFSQYISIFQAV